jgi:hypothetical protein
MRPSRSIPRVGMSATVRYLAVDEPAVVARVLEGGRCVTARTEQGEAIDFTLIPATAHYRAAGSGPRLILGSSSSAPSPHV